jgi:hypothetical protein
MTCDSHLRISPSTDALLVAYEPQGLNVQWQFNDECVEPLVYAPGACRAECHTDRDAAPAGCAFGPNSELGRDPWCRQTRSVSAGAGRRDLETWWSQARGGLRFTGWKYCNAYRVLFFSRTRTQGSCTSGLTRRRPFLRLRAARPAPCTLTFVEVPQRRAIPMIVTGFMCYREIQRPYFRS